MFRNSRGGRALSVPVKSADALVTSSPTIVSGGDQFLPGFSTRIVKGKNEGLIINKGDKHNITVKLSDYDNNNTYINLKIIGDSTNFKYDKQVETPFNKLIDSNKKYNFSYNGHELIIEKNTFDRKSKILFQKSKKNDEYLLRGRQKA